MITITAFRNLVKQSVEDNDAFVYLGEPQSHAILCKGISEGAYDYSYAYELSFSVDDYECFVEDLAKMLGYPKIDDSYREGALYTIATPLHPIFLITPDDRNVVDSSVCVQPFMLPLLKMGLMQNSHCMAPVLRFILH